MHFPKSCDTFVVLPPLTKGNVVIFGKNSDRPQNEVQEVILVKDRPREAKLKCTYITIDESASRVHDVALSKPAWMWGAEMGANDEGVVIGNEAVWTNHNEGDGDAAQKRLLGMDLVRLGLERGATATGALDAITELLERHGQGGPCSEFDDSHFYHNSFLIADPSSAWVLETSGKLWAAEEIRAGYRNISNGLTIRTHMDRHSEGLTEKAEALGLWDGRGEFDFTEAFSSGGDEARQRAGERLLREGSRGAAFDVQDMFDVLRDKESSICRGCDDTFPTQGSQVSSLAAHGRSVHWFTATPDPSASCFKPFVFTPGAQASPHTRSADEPKREHRLYTVHAASARGAAVARRLRALECGWLEATRAPPAADLDCLMKNCVDAELQLYG